MPVSLPYLKVLREYHKNHKRSNLRWFIASWSDAVARDGPENSRSGYFLFKAPYLKWMGNFAAVNANRATQPVWKPIFQKIYSKKISYTLKIYFFVCE